MKKIHFKTITSTNDYLKNNYDSLEHYSVVYSDHQSKGRGQFNRTFQSNNNSGLYCSILLKEHIKGINLNLLTFYVAYCCLKAIKKITNYTIDIKWINDLYFKNKKLGGILIESIYSNNTLEACVIGIGINILNSDFNEDLKDKVITLQQITKQKINRDLLLDTIIEELQNLNTMNIDELLLNYKKHCISLNKKFKINDIEYLAFDIDNQGNLLLKNQKDIIKLNSSYQIKA